MTPVLAPNSSVPAIGRRKPVVDELSAMLDATGDEFVESQHPRDHGKFASGAGSSGGSAERGATIAKHVTALKQHAAATSEFLKGKTAGEVFASVAKHPKTKEAISAGLQSLVSHAAGLDASTWKLNEEAIEHTVTHFGDIIGVAAGEARALMRKALEALVAARTAGARDAAEGDGVTASLLALIDLLGDDDGDTEIKKSNNQEFNLNADPGALDSALTMALDRDSVRTKDRDGRMRVSFSNISKACVNPYRGNEIPGWEALGLDPNRIYKLLRHPDELKKAAPSFNGVQILRKHTPVSAQDAQQWEVVGSTGSDAKFDGQHLSNSLNIWTQEGIDDIESGAKRELSSGYHYDPDMTPGEFDGEAYDGVMRNIVGNHVALVRDGRAGSDVVVGDSAEEIKMADNRELAKTLAAISSRQISIGALAAYLAPRYKPAVIALDSKPPGIMHKIFGDISGAKFKENKPVIAKRVREVCGPLLAKDASLDDVEKVLDMLDGHEVEGGDASVSEPQHNAMEAAAHGASALDIPKKVGEEFAKKDEVKKTFDENAFREHLKSSGMDEAGIATTMGMLPKPTGLDEDEDAKKKREAEEAKKADEAKAKDAAMKDMVTKPAMDAAISSAVDTAVKHERENQRALHSALAKVRPIVGELSMSFDSGEQVFRHVLKVKGVKDADTLHASALETLIDYLPKPGMEHRDSAPRLAQDESSASDFEKRFPDAGRIQDAM